MTDSVQSAGSWWDTDLTHADPLMLKFRKLDFSIGVALIVLPASLLLVNMSVPLPVWFIVLSSAILIVGIILAGMSGVMWMEQLAVNERFEE